MMIAITAVQGFHVRRATTRDGGRGNVGCVEGKKIVKIQIINAVVQCLLTGHLVFLWQQIEMSPSHNYR